MIDACVSNAMLETAAYTDVDAILTSGKEQYVGTVIEEAQRKLDAAGTGITLQAIELTNVSMPEEVRYVYEQVNASTVEASTMIENAKQYRNTIIPQAESVANLTVQSAHTAYAYGVSGATNSLNEFWGVLEEYQASPDVVRARIYREKMVRALSTIGKIRVVTDDDSKIVISGE